MLKRRVSVPVLRLAPKHDDEQFTFDVHEIDWSDGTQLRPGALFRCL